MESLIEVRNIFKKFGNKIILQNINLQINKGDIFGIIGGSGAGKTVFLKLLIGFLKPDKGTILLTNENIHNKISHIRKTFGFCTQDHCFYPELTVLENINYSGRIYQVNSKIMKRTCNALLNLLELESYKDTIAKNLSGGTQRRLDIICSMIHSPRVLLLDEPLTGLDPILRKKMIKILREINALGITIILSSHYLDEIEDFCTNIGILNKSELMICDTPQNVRDKYAKYTILKICSSPGNYAKILEKINQLISLKQSKITKTELELHLARPTDNSNFYKIVNIISSQGETITLIEYELPKLNETFENLIT